MAQAPSPNSSPSKSPRQALDDEPDFDISPDLNVIRNSIGWGDVANQVPIIGLSRQLHRFLRLFDPVSIKPEPGPYRHDVICKVVSALIVHHRQLLMVPGQRGTIRVANIPDFRAICGRDEIQFNELAKILRRHLVLLDIARPQQTGAQNNP